MFKKILVPLDGSGPAEEALGVAAALARQEAAELLLLRSVQTAYSPLPVVVGLPNEFEWPWPAVGLEVGQREARDYLATVARRHECAGCVVRTLSHEGDPAGVIVDTAEAEAVDLIVMSAHGRTGMRRAVFGSVTERVLHSVTCPVLLTRSAAPIRRILIALDGSPLGERALPPVLAIARALGAQIVLLRVNDQLPLNPLEVSLVWDWEPGPSEKQVVDEMRRSAEAYLRAVAARHGLGPDEAQTLVLEGAPAERIQEYARLSAIDLIAMSTHGRTGLRRWLYGSVTAKVMRGSERAMLIVRPPEGELRDS
jgi:nucleotide-binding universal stress UspA family protein